MNEYHDIDLTIMQHIKNTQTANELLRLLLHEYEHRAYENNEEYAKIVCNKIYELIYNNTQKQNYEPPFA